MPDSRGRNRGVRSWLVAAGSLAILIGCLADSRTATEETAAAPPEVSESETPLPEAPAEEIAVEESVDETTDENVVETVADRTFEEPPVVEEGPRVVVGEPPPDFVLPRLRFDESADGRPIGVINESDKVQLSSYFGERPVCMFMSSFT